MSKVHETISQHTLSTVGTALAILLIAAVLAPRGLAARRVDAPAVPAVDDPFYPDFDDLLDWLQDLAADHPSIVDYQDIGDATHGSRDVVALKISDNVGDDEDEPAWAFTGIIHGSEQLGLRILLDLADELTTEYGSDSAITDAVDAYEIWLIFALNPWGYDHDSSGGDRATGTRRNGASSSYTDTSGVDLARNYDFRWEHGGSTDPTDSRYRGPDPFSEDETEAIRDLFLEQRPLFGITYHQGNDPDGGQIMRPWSGSGSDAPPDADLLGDYADLFADWVHASRLTGPFCDSPALMDPDGQGSCTSEDDHEFCDELCWEPEQSTLGRYGQPSNWYYHELGTFDYTVEISDRTFNGDFMHDPDGPGVDAHDLLHKAIATEFARNHVDAIKDWFAYFLYSHGTPFQYRGPGITGHVTDALLSTPLNATIEVSGYTSSLIEDRTSDSEYGRFWRLLPAGTHTVMVSKPGYDPWLANVAVGGDALTEQDVALTPHLDVSLPDAAYVAWVGDPSDPRTFTVRFTLGSAGDPCIGPLPFSVFVRDDTSTWIEADTGVQACVQDSYWISVQAPDDGDGAFTPDGIYDLKVELDTVSGESDSAVRYTDREEDVVLVMDVSGSMGESGKLDAAEEAGALLINELADNDQGALVWFSGDGTEPNLDADTPFELDAMTVGNQAALITAIKTLSLQNMTSIGDGLTEGLEETASPRADPDHYCSLVLLSDGVENEEAYWSEVQPDAAESPCLIHVVALGPDADELLLQDIKEKGTADPADDGSYLYATVSDTVSSASGAASPSAHWPNQLAGIYDEIGSRMAQRQRIFKTLGSVDRTPDTHFIRIDDTLDEAVFALKWSGMDDAAQLELTDPGGVVLAPSDPDVSYRSSATDQVYRVEEPKPGLWQARVINLEPQHDNLPYILVASGQTPIEFRLYTSADHAPIHQGEQVQILGLLTRRGQPITGANVRVTVEAPDGRRSKLRLYDDGLHADGSADDGFYANAYDRTIAGDQVQPRSPEREGLDVRGSYVVEGSAQTYDWLRLASTSFAVIPSPDGDSDGMPDPWEKAHGLDPSNPNDAQGDPDLDGLPSVGEFLAGTDPHDSDSDDGGEGDGSEVSAARDPMWPGDDTIAPVTDLIVDPLPLGARLTWTSKPSHTAYQIWRRKAGAAWQLIEPGLSPLTVLAPASSYNDVNLENGVTYDYQLFALGDRDQNSGSSGTSSVTPVADPFAPEGSVLINDGASVTAGRPVTLTFEADGDTMEMRLGSEIDDGTDEIGGSWRAYQSRLAWTIPVEVAPGGAWTIHTQFRDAAKNTSDVVTDTILYQPVKSTVYLPLILRR
jgi:hypothetical protein